MDNKLINRRHFMKSSVAGMAGFICLPFTNKKQGKNQKERKLIYRTLGKTGIRVPVIGMGILSSGSPALIRAAQQQVDRGRVRAVIGQLGAFINQVNAFIRSRKLTMSEGQPLIEAANVIIDDL